MRRDRSGILPDHERSIRLVPTKYSEESPGELRYPYNTPMPTLDIFQPDEYPEDPDDALMRRVARGDADAFGEIVRAYQGRIGAFATRMLGGDRADAEDVTQETFLRLWHGRCRYRPSGNLSGFLLRVAANLCRDRHRAEGGRVAENLDDLPELFASTLSPEEALQAATLADAVRQAIHDLPEGQRAVFVLSHYDGRAYREIAEILDCPIGTVASRKNLAVAALRRRLGHYREN